MKITTFEQKTETVTITGHEVLYDADRDVHIDRTTENGKVGNINIRIPGRRRIHHSDIYLTLSHVDTKMLADAINEFLEALNE